MLFPERDEVRQRFREFVRKDFALEPSFDELKLFALRHAGKETSAALDFLALSSHGRRLQFLKFELEKFESPDRKEFVVELKNHLAAMATLESEWRRDPRFPDTDEKISVDASDGRTFANTEPSDFRAYRHAIEELAAKLEIGRPYYKKPLADLFVKTLETAHARQRQVIKHVFSGKAEEETARALEELSRLQSEDRDRTYNNLRTAFEKAIKPH